jgi:PIN domain nuclease of toxin-antitoxin system
LIGGQDGGLPPDLLVALAAAEGLTLVTRDRRLCAYGVPILVA